MQQVNEDQVLLGTCKHVVPYLRTQRDSAWLEDILAFSLPQITHRIQLYARFVCFSLNWLPDFWKCLFHGTSVRPELEINNLSCCFYIMTFHFKCLLSIDGHFLQFLAKVLKRESGSIDSRLIHSLETFNKEKLVFQTTVSEFGMERQTQQTHSQCFQSCISAF